jgi:hypothetical protein
MTPEQAAALRAPFPKTAISHLPKGGTTLDYIGHAAVTQRLLEVDPNWNWEPVATDESGLPKFDDRGGLWLRLTICGVSRLGYGEPQGQDPYDKTKGSIGNAIRNAAMRFGVGLDLWSKDDITTTAPEPPKPVATDADLARWSEGIEGAQDVGALENIRTAITQHHIDPEIRRTLAANWTARHLELTQDSA